MMNARVLELLRQPEIINSEDLKLLEHNIRNHPYAQSFRALHLYGISKLDEENYKKQLSITAAYTTDKKILYQFLNKERNSHHENQNIFVEENPEEKTSLITENHIDIALNSEDDKTIATEENLMQNPSDFKKEAKENSPKIPEAKNEIVQEVKIYESAKIEKTITEDTSQLSFHGTEGFMTDVKILPKSSEHYIPKPQLSKHELEMQKLIAEVEAKMKAKKQQNELTKTVENTNKNQLEYTDKQEINSKEKELTIEKSSFVEPKKNPITETKQNSTWKPMGFFSNTPDSLIKKEEKPEPKPQVLPDQKEEKLNIEENRPVLNVSFFSPNLEQIKEVNSEEKTAEIPQKEENSNIPKFLNTWQSWLKLNKTEEVSSNQKKEDIEVKIDDSEEKNSEQKEEEKAQIIDKFIENEPKISKLKEESNFVVKEKNDDISHLMTETLAHLYIEQRLYTKAIKAFEILIGKHPEKELYFQEKIKEIKELRSKN